MIGVRFASRIGMRQLVFALAFLALSGIAVFVSNAMIDPSSARADELSTALYVRTDGDRTTVISPRARANKRLSEVISAEASYAADVWTSASIDIRTSASVRPVTEQRDEMNLRLNGDWNDLHARAGYRLSLEPDYTSHGASIGAAYDLAGKATILDANLQLLFDSVGRSGNPHFARALGTVAGRVSLTQVLDPMTYVQLTYEPAHSQGYQASPYRFVGLGRDAVGYGCLGATLCLPEYVPHARNRHAIAVAVRRAQTETLSLAATYRFYIDGWHMYSHTLQAELGWTIAQHSLLQLQYRYYWQRRVDFYRTRYLNIEYEGYRTRDRELTGMSSHHGGVGFEHEFPLRGRPGRFVTSLLVSGNLFGYREFVGLNRVRALEVTAALMLEI